MKSQYHGQEKWNKDKKPVDDLRQIWYYIIMSKKKGRNK